MQHISRNSNHALLGRKTGSSDTGTTNLEWCGYMFGLNSSKAALRSLPFKRRTQLERLPIQFLNAQRPRAWNVTCLARGGYVGMWLSMWMIWKRAITECKEAWTILFESDARLPPSFNRQFGRYDNVFRNKDIVWLDNRAGFGHGPHGCCTVAVAYRTSKLQPLIEHFDPDNPQAYWNDYKRRQKKIVNDQTCLTDWYLANLVDHLHLRAYRAGIVMHPVGFSEIHSK